MKKKDDKKAKKIAKAIRMIYDSLESHLDWTHPTKKEMRIMKSRDETPEFHKKCVREYAELIMILSELY